MVYTQKDIEKLLCPAFNVALMTFDEENKRIIVEIDVENPLSAMMKKTKGKNTLDPKDLYR